MEVEIAFLLVIAAPGLERFVALMGFQHMAQSRRSPPGSCALRSQAAGHALQRLADIVQFDQLALAERHYSRPDVGNSGTSRRCPFKAVDGLAQRPTADAIRPGQLRLGNLAAGSDIATTMAAWIRWNT